MSDFTKNTYERSLTTIRKGLGIKDGLEFLQDSKRVIDWISSSKYATNSRKVFYIAIVSTLKKSDLYPEAWLEYKARMDELNRSVAVASEEQTLTEKESEKFVEWPLVLKTLEDIQADVSDLASFQDYLIVSLYTLMPPVRLDYAEMKVAKAEPEKPDCNYLIMNQKPYFLLTQYKTAKKYGATRLPIPKNLLTIINEWLEMNDSEDFLISPNSNKPMPPWELGQTIIRVFKKHLDKDVGVNVLRHSHATWLRRNEMSLKDSKELAKAMQHSVGMSQLYRRIK
jgi:integrase